MLPWLTQCEIKVCLGMSQQLRPKLLLIYCIVKAGVAKATPRTIEYRSYRGFDENAFIQDLNNVPWYIVDDENNVNDAVLT